jgi:hypothetical protein
MNPYSPPTTDVSTAEPTNRRPVAFFVLGLSLLQLVWLLLCMSAYFELVRTGTASLLTGLSGFVGCVLLYVGAARFAANAARGNYFFIASFAFLILSLRGWGIQYFWSYPYILAVVICIAGWWLSRRRAILKSTDG